MSLNIDTSNYTIAIVGYVIVFIALVLLYAVFANIPKVMRFALKYRHMKLGKKEECNDCGDFIPGVENAAIVAAIYLFFNEIHDEESTKMTIKKVKKDYSPWSSKIHGISTLSK